MTPAVIPASRQQCCLGVDALLPIACCCIVQVDFAMVSLKKSMKWDEDVFGLEYDLVSKFNGSC